MPDIYGINYNGVKPRPTFEELINFVDYPVKYPDRSATFTRESPLLTQFDGIGMMELQEQEQREIAERQKDDMIRQIAAATGQSAQMLRALNRRRFYTPTDSLADSRFQDVDEEIADHLQQQEEQHRLNDERLMAMHNELWREWFGEDYDPAQIRAAAAGSLQQLGDLPPGSNYFGSVPSGYFGSVPSGSNYFGSGYFGSVPSGSGYFGSVYSGSKSGSFGSVPSASIVPASTGSGDLFERLQPPQKPLHNLLLTIEELEQMDDELLNFEMTFRSIPFTAETTREEKIRLILQHQSPSKAKSPAAKAMGTFMAPNLSSPPIPVPPKTTIPKTNILKPPIPKHRATPIMIPKTLPPKARPPAKAAAAALPPAKAALPPAKSAATLPVPTGSGDLYERPLPPAKAAAAAAAVERRLVPSTGLTASMLRDYSDEEIDAELRHLGILFYGTTRRFEKNKMILEHYDNVREFDQKVQQEARAKSRGISDEQINSLANSSLIPIDDIRAMADWTVPKLKDELKKRGAQISSDTRKLKLLSMLVHALMLERQRAGRIGRVGRTRSSGAMSVDPRSSGAMSVDL